MGFLAKVGNSRTIDPVDCRVAVPPSEAAPFLTRAELLTFAVYRTLLARAMRPMTSSWGVPNERVAPSVLAVRSGVSQLRVRGIPSAIQVALGATAPDGRFSADWELQGAFHDQGAHLAATQIRMLDGKLENAELFKEIRSLLVDTLAGPTPELQVVSGVPALDQWISPVPVARPEGGGELRFDYFAPVPDSFGSGNEIELPDIDLAALREILAATPFPLLEGTQAVPLGADGADSISARGNGDGACLVVRVRTDHERMARLRLFRTSMVILNDLARRLKTVAPESFRAVVGFVERQCGKAGAPAWTVLMREGLRDPGFFASNYDTSRVVPLNHGALFPVALVVRGADRSLAETLRTSRAWLLVRGRMRTSGLRKDTRYANAAFTTRRAVGVQAGDKIMPSVRYAQTTDLPVVFDSTLPETSPNAWFWETVLRSRTLDDRRHTVVTLTGATRLGDALMYGEEYLRHLGEFSRIVSATDPTAEIDTVLLRL